MVGRCPPVNNEVMTTAAHPTTGSSAAALGTATAEEGLVITPPSQIQHEVTHLQRFGIVAAALAAAAGATYMWATVDVVAVSGTEYGGCHSGSCPLP